MNPILAVGSVAFDSIQTKWGKAENIVGGSLSYFTSAAGLFTEVYPVCIVGEDFPDPLETWGKNRKINLKFFVRTPGKTFRWSGIYHEDMDYRETVLTDLGVFAQFKPIVDSKWAALPFLFLGNISPLLQLSVLKQVDQNVFSAMDTMNFWIDGNPSQVYQVLSEINLMMINNEELYQLTNEQEEQAALDKIFSQGCKLVIVKKGKGGAELHSPENCYKVGIYSVLKVVDTTGAGDSFAGGVLGYLAEKCENSSQVKWDILCRAMCFGTATASLSVESFGIDRLSAATREEVDLRAEKIFNESS
ncbi:MAG: hypothetical protein APR63_02645 [Desulfuromonas sp. SDB]|nr:MAG: hypothetical protein APR63_02645 [Desulfuromonas sp. SDB]